MKKLLFGFILSLFFAGTAFSQMGNPYNQAGMSNKTSSSVSSPLVDITTVTDGNLPYMQAAGAGFGDSPLSVSSGNIVNSGDLTVQGGDLGIGVSATEPGDIVQHDAGTTTFHDDGNNTNVIIGPVADGTTTLGITGSLNVSATVTAVGFSGPLTGNATTATSIAGITETNGGMLYGTADNAYAWLAAGAEGTLLMGNGAGAPSWLGAGTAGYFLIANGAADPVWTTQPTLTSLEGLAFTNGDIIYSSAADTLAVLDSGTATYQLTANGAAAPSWNKPREFAKLDLTADTSISEAQIIANKWISNQGDDGESDLTLPAVSYPIQVIFSVEEVQNIEINPPAGEILDLDGTALDANDCVDSDSTVGSKISAVRLQIADGSWRWSLDTIRGVWSDTGPSD